MKEKGRILLLSVISAVFLIVSQGFGQEEFPIQPVKKYTYSYSDKTVVGRIQYYRVKPSDTLLDIARTYGLGINDLQLIYSNMDPWIPPRDTTIMIPTLWILPQSRYKRGIVLNIPEFRLYFLKPEESTVQTYPVGIGDEGWETPVGSYSIQSKRENPTWYIPPSLQEKYGAKTMPPGPENPLGKFMMKFAPMYGIHGTHMPWGVGRLVSHGCIRTYPEHIAVLYPQVNIGTPVEIIYEPIKFGFLGDRIYVEVHPDVYNKLQNFMDYAMKKLSEFPGAPRVDKSRYGTALTLKNGVPTDVTKDDFQDSLVSMEH